MTDAERDELLLRIDRGQETHARLLYELVSLVEHLTDDPKLVRLLPKIHAAIGREVFGSADLARHGAPELGAALEALAGPRDDGFTHRLGVKLGRLAGRTGGGFRLLQAEGQHPALFQVIQVLRRRQ